MGNQRDIVLNNIKRFLWIEKTRKFTDRYNGQLGQKDKNSAIIIQIAFLKSSFFTNMYY